MKNTTTIVLTILLLSAIGAGAYYWQINNSQVGNYQNQIGNLQQQLNETGKPATLPSNQISNLLNTALPDTIQKHYTIKDDYLIETTSGEKLLATKVSGLVDPELKQTLGPNGYLDPAQEWLQFVKDEKIRLYVLRWRGCGGCAWTDHYFEINPTTDKATLKTITGPFAYLADGLPSPNQTLVAQAETNNPNEGPPCHKAVAESVWVYDLVNNTSKKIKDLPIGATIFSCGDGWYTDHGTLTWNGDASITVNPFRAPREYIETKPGHSELDSTRYGEQWTINI